MVMGINGKQDPAWLNPLVATEFYNYCSRHHVQENFFCYECLETLCDRCKNTFQHHGHKILQVFKASNHVAVRSNCVEKLFDISYIQRYAINLHSVIYLNSRTRKGQENGQYPNKCEICLWGLKENCSRFCSISCKIEEKKMSAKVNSCIDDQTPAKESRDAQTINCVNVSSTNNNGQKYEEAVNFSFRRRSRKGIPRRSPLF